MEAPLPPKPDMTAHPDDDPAFLPRPKTVRVGACARCQQDAGGMALIRAALDERIEDADPYYQEIRKMAAGARKRKIIVSGIDSTVKWLRTFTVFEDFEVMAYLGNALHDLESGDVVCGTLPLGLVAQVCETGAEYWHINFRGGSPRGRHLTFEELRERATVERYEIRVGRRIV